MNQDTQLGAAPTQQAKLLPDSTANPLTQGSNYAIRQTVSRFRHTCRGVLIDDHSSWPFCNRFGVLTNRVSLSFKVRRVMRILLIATIAVTISIPCTFAQSGPQGATSNSGNPTKSGPQNNGGRSGQSSDSADDDRYITPKDGEAQRNRKSDAENSRQSGSQNRRRRAGQSLGSADDDRYITPKDGEAKPSPKSDTRNSSSGVGSRGSSGSGQTGTRGSTEGTTKR